MLENEDDLVRVEPSIPEIGVYGAEVEPETDQGRLLSLSVGGGEEGMRGGGGKEGGREGGDGWNLESK